MLWDKLAKEAIFEEQDMTAYLAVSDTVLLESPSERGKAENLVK